MILPVVYLFIAGVLFLACVLHMGHSPWCQRFLDSMFPAQWLSQMILQALSSQGMASQRPEAWRFLYMALTLPVPSAVTIAQYFLLGLIVDKFIAWVRR